jgi:hypothetical protein
MNISPNVPTAVVNSSKARASLRLSRLDDTFNEDRPDISLQSSYILAEESPGWLNGKF